MAYTTAAGGYGASASVFHFSAAHSDTIVIPDAELLFTGDFKRHGPDLILTGHDGRHHVVPGYFSSEKHPALVAPNGASLSAALVDLLAGSPTPGQFAQASPTPTDPIGKVEKVVGHVVVIRNGVAIALNVGDAVYKSDIIQTGANSSCGLDFPDGTALNLVANTRMALNDYSYDPNGNSNDALFSLVQGTFAFVAGKVAHTGDMKIETPVATMGIRGTTGFVQEQIGTISANIGNVTYSFAVVEDYGTGRVGQYELIDPQGNVVATVSQNGFLTYVTPQGTNLPPIVTTQPMSNTQLGFEQQIIQQVFQVLNSGTNPNPQSNPGNNGSSSPPSPLHNLPQLLQNNGNGTTFTVGGNGSGGQSSTSNTQSSNTTAATPTVTWVGSFGGDWNNPYNWSDGVVPLAWEVVDLSSKATLSGGAIVAGLVITSGGILNIVGGGDLTLSNSLEIAQGGALQLNSSGVDPTLAISGTVNLTGGGSIFLFGTGDNNIIASGSGAKLTDVDNTIKGSGTIGHLGDGALTLVNGSNGIIDATPLLPTDSGILIINTGNLVDNFYVMAADGGTLKIEDAVKNEIAGLIGATDGGSVVFTGASVDNFGSIGSTTGPTGGGTVSFVNVTVTNEAGAEVSTGGSSTFVSFTGGTIINDAGSVGLLLLGTQGNPEGIWAYDGGTVTFSDEQVTNTGLITAIVGGTIVTPGTGGTINFDDTTVNNSGGTIAAANFVGANTSVLVSLSDSTIEGGTLETSGPGSSGTNINVVPASGLNLSVLDGSTEGPLVIAGYLGVFAGAQLELKGTINIDSANGVIDAAGPTNGSTAPGIILIDGSVSVSTDGLSRQPSINLGSSGVSGEILAAPGTTGDTLSNDVWISGLGQIGAGDGALTLINEAGGQIQANVGTSLSGTLTLDIGAAGNPVANANLIDAAAGATLVIENTTIDNASTQSAAGDTGKVTAQPGSIIELDNATVLQGTVATGAATATSAAGEIETAIGSSNAIETADGSYVPSQPTISNAGTTLINDNSSLILASPNAIDNSGAIELNSSTHQTFLYFNQPFPVLSGGGSIILDGGSGSQDIIDGQLGQGFTVVKLDNQSNTISGAGAIGQNDGLLQLQNDSSAFVDADFASQTLTIETGNTVTNTGALEATSGGILAIDDNVANSNGTISAVGAHSVVQLSGAAITAGTISGTGTFEVTVDSKISGVGLGDFNVANVKVDAGATLTLDGDTVSGTAFTNLVTVHNNVTSVGTISVDANDTLTLDNTTVNGGALKVASGAILNLENSHLTDVDLSEVHGTINVSGTSTVDGATNVEGGQITIVTGDVLVVNENSVLFGIITDDGTLRVDGGDTANFAGVTLTGGVVDDYDVSGGGAIDITGASEIEGTGLGADEAQLTGTNGSLVTLDAQLTLDYVKLNGISIDAGAGTALILDNTVEVTAATTLTGLTVTDNDILQIEDGVTLKLAGDTINDGTIDDYSSTAGGNIDVTAASEIEGTGTGSAEALLDGNGAGTVTLDAGLTLDYVQLNGIAIETDSALSSAQMLTLAGAVEATGAVTLENLIVDGSGASTLVTVDSGKTLTLNGDTFNDVTLSGGTDDLTGTLTIASSSEIDSSIVDGSGNTVTVDSGMTLTLNAVTLEDVTLSGGTITDDGNIAVTAAGGEIASAIVDGGDLTAAAGTLTLSETTLDGVKLAGSGFVNSDTLTIDGTVTLNGATITNTGATIDDTGTLSVTAASEIGGGVLNLSGALEVTGTTAFTDLDLELTNNGILFVGGTLKISGTTVDGGRIIDSGTIDVTGNSTLENSGPVESQITVESGVILTLSDMVLADGAAVTDDGTVQIYSLNLIGASVTGDGTITDLGTLNVAGSGNSIASVSITNDGEIIEIDGAATLSLSDTTIKGGSVDDYSGTGGGSILVSAASEIEGTGTGSDEARLDGGGAGIVQLDSTLTLDDVSLSSLTVETDPALMALTPPEPQTLVLDGTVEASGAVTFQNLVVTDNGTLQIDTGATLTLDDTAISGSGNSVNDGTILAPTGTTSSITLDSGTTAAGAVIEADGGSLTIADNGSDNSGTLKAINGGSLTLTHSAATADATSTDEASGMVEAIGTGSIVTINALVGDTNYGTEEATGAGTLDINVGVSTNVSYQPTGGGNYGTIDADGGTVNITGGLLNASGEIANVAVAGSIEAQNGGTAFISGGLINDYDFATGVGATVEAIGATSEVELSGGTIGNGGLIEAGTATQPGGKLVLHNTTIDNGAFIELNGAAGAAAKMVIAGAVTLNPGTLANVSYPGAVILAGSNDSIVSNGSAATLTIDDGTITGATITISGAGTIGDANLTLDNDAGGIIDATGAYPLTIDTGANTITNAGTLEATGGTLDVDSTVTNTGMITAGAGTVDLTEAVTGAGAGQVSGGTLEFDATSGLGSLTQSSGTLTVESNETLTIADASFIFAGTNNGGGTIVADGGISFFGASSQAFTLDGGTTLELSGSSGAGPFAGDTININNGSQLIIASGTTFTDSSTTGTAGQVLSFDTSGNTAGTLINDGNYVKTGDGTTDIYVAFTNADDVDVQAGTLDFAAGVTGTGAIGIDTGGIAEFGASVANTQTITFGDATGTLAIGDAADFKAVIAGFGAGGTGNTIDLTGIAYSSGDYDVWASGNSTLTIYNSSGTPEATLNFTGTYQSYQFALTSDGATTPGTDVVVSPLSVTNDNGVETATTNAGTLVNENGHWVLQDSGYTTTIDGVDSLTINNGPTAGTYLLVGDGGFSTIQAAIDKAQTGDTVLVAPGTYNEQDVIDATHGASGISIEGVGGPGAVTVEAPTTLQETAISPTSQNPIDGIFTVDGVNNVTISNIAINGLDYGDEGHFAPNQPGTGTEGPSLIGIAYVNARGGTISNDAISGTDEAPAGIGDQRNFGIYVANTDPLGSADVPDASQAGALNSITIENSNLSSFQKGGIVVEYADATISGNTLTGAGAVGTSQNAIQISGSTGEVSDNIISEIANILGPPNNDAATGVLAFDNYGLAITGNQFTGALENGQLVDTPVGVYVLDSTNGKIENNTAANVDDGVVVFSDGYGDDILGSWTVEGNTTTDVVPVSQGGGSIYFDPDPTMAGSSFVATGGTADIGDVFFVSPGADTLTGGGGGGNTFVVVNGADLSAADTVTGEGTGNVIDFASSTSGDTLTVGSNVTGVQEVDVVGSTGASTDTTQLNVNIAAAPGILTVVANDGGDTITGNAGNDTLHGGTGNDTFNLGGGSNTVTGGGGVDVVNFAAGTTLTASDFSYSTGTWSVANGVSTDTLSGIEKVTDGNGHTFLLVDQAGTGAYATIQGAIDAATAGETVLVANGTYNENVALKNGVNVIGQSEADVAIDGTLSTPQNFDNTTVSNLTVDDNSSTAMLLDMTATQEVTSSTFDHITFNLESDSTATILVGNGQVAYSMALNGTGLTFSNVAMNSNDHNFDNSTAFAYTLFHSVGGAQLVLDGVSLNGTASGTDSGLGAQWNMSPNSSETANVTIENSSTSGGGNFYVSGMADATITGDTFDGQGLALNGVAEASVTGNTFENVDGTYTANGTQDRGLTIENAWGATGDSNITVTGNTFTDDSAADGAIAFQRWTDDNGNLIPATINTLDDVTVDGSTFTGVTTPIYLNTSSFGATSLVPSTFGDPQLIIGTADNDAITAPATGNTAIYGGGGIDTVEVGAGYHIAIQSGQWVVTNGAVTDTLSGIDKVDINGAIYDLVDTFGASGGFQSLQAAIDAATNGDKILVAPGTYTESANYDPVTGLDDTANGTNPLGLLVDKSVSIEGVDASGNIITGAPTSNPTIVSSIESDWGTNFYIAAPNVTITGVNFEGTDLEYGQNPENQGGVNKVIEVVATGFTLQDSVVDGPTGIPLGSSVYIDDPTAPGYGSSLSSFQSAITAFTIAHNILDGDFVEASGVGYNDPTTNFAVTDNEFSLNPGSPSGFGNWVIILDGQLNAPPLSVDWDNAPVVDPSITGNTVEADYTASPYGLRFLAADDSADNLPALGYIENYVAANNLGTYAYAVTAEDNPDYTLYYGSYYYEVAINAGDDSAVATPGDTLVVQSGTDSSVQTIVTDQLIIDAQAGSSDLNLLMGPGLTTITLTGDVNTNVAGNGGPDAIYANDASDILAAGAGAATFYVGGGNDTLIGSGTGSNDTAVFAHPLSDYTVTLNANGATLTFALNGTSVVDTATDIQNFTFTDGPYTAASIESLYGLTPGPQTPDTWTGATNDGSWSTAENWSNGSAPVAYDIAQAIDNNTYTVTIASGSNENVDALNFANPNATLDIAGSLTVWSATSSVVDGPVVNSGTFNVVNGSLDLNGPVANDGTLVAAGGTLDITGPVTGTGAMTIGDGASLEFQSSVAATQTVTFTGATGELELAPTATFSGEIASFTGTAGNAASSDEIVLSNFTSDPVSENANYNTATNVTTLTVSDSLNSSLFVSINFVGDYVGEFAFQQNGSDVDIFDPPANSSTTPVSVGNDRFVFDPNLGGDAAGTNSPDNGAAPDHFTSAHNAEWSALIVATQEAETVEVAQPADSHWHHALHNATHLH